MRININYPNFSLEADFALPSSGCVAFYGPSGSGKSTILRAAAGLISGANEPLKREKIGFVPQNYMLFEHLNLAQNLLTCRRKNFWDEFSAKFRKEFLDEYLQNLLKTAGISHLAHQKPYQLSGGQRQRAALCCALANRPEFLLLDEPFSALDDVSKRALIELLRRFMREFSLKVLLISHSAEEVRALAEKIYIIEDGKITNCLKNSDFSEIYNKPL